jgi:hypothetical protein
MATNYIFTSAMVKGQYPYFAFIFDPPYFSVNTVFKAWT